MHSSPFAWRFSVCVSSVVCMGQMEHAVTAFEFLPGHGRKTNKNPNGANIGAHNNNNGYGVRVCYIHDRLVLHVGLA